MVLTFKDLVLSLYPSRLSLGVLHTAVSFVFPTLLCLCLLYSFLISEFVCFCGNFLELLKIFLFWVQDWCFKVLTCCKIYKRYSFTCKAWTVGAFKSGRTTKSQFLWNFFFHHPVGCAGISSCWAYWTITLWLLLVCHKKWTRDMGRIRNPSYGMCSLRGGWVPALPPSLE